MVRDVFRLAKENSPCSTMFIGATDTIVTKHVDAQTGSDREVQRILLELLIETNVKVIIATSRTGYA